MRSFLTASVLGGLLMAETGCGTDAEQPFAGLTALTVQTTDGLGYRLRYLSPPWELITADPVARGEVLLQWGRADQEGDPQLDDLAAVQGSVRVLEIERSGRQAAAGGGAIVYPKYRLEVAVLRCDDLAIEVAPAESCARAMSRTDEANRAGAERSGFFGAEGREGENAFGQRYHEFMTQVNDTRRFRRVVYFETSQRLATIRLGFEATSKLSEVELDQMISSFEVLDANTGAPEDM